MAPLKSASGRQFVCATGAYAVGLRELRGTPLEPLVLVAQVGQLVELLEVHGGWGYGAPMGVGRFPMPGVRGEKGVFRLVWVGGPRC